MDSTCAKTLTVHSEPIMLEEGGSVDKPQKDIIYDKCGAWPDIRPLRKSRKKTHPHLDPQVARELTLHGNRDGFDECLALTRELLAKNGKDGVRQGKEKKEAAMMKAQQQKEERKQQKKKDHEETMERQQNEKKARAAHKPNYGKQWGSQYAEQSWYNWDGNYKWYDDAEWHAWHRDNKLYKEDWKGSSGSGQQSAAEPPAEKEVEKSSGEGQQSAAETPAEKDAEKSGGVEKQSAAQAPAEKEAEKNRGNEKQSAKQAPAEKEAEKSSGAEKQSAEQAPAEKEGERSSGAEKQSAESTKEEELEQSGSAASSHDEPWQVMPKYIPAPHFMNAEVPRNFLDAPQQHAMSFPPTSFAGGMPTLVFQLDQAVMTIPAQHKAMPIAAIPAKGPPVRPWWQANLSSMVRKPLPPPQQQADCHFKMPFQWQ